MKYIIDGRHLTGNISGVQRYLREVLAEMDKFVPEGEIEVLVPKNNSVLPQYKNIKVIELGYCKNILWSQFIFPFYAVTHKKQGLYLCTTVPYLYPRGIVVIHDVMLKRYKNLARSFKFLSRIALKLNYFLSTKFCSHIMTVSQTSKNDLMEFYKVPSSRITIAPNAYQHINAISEDTNLFTKYPFIKNGEFFLALSANRWQKNFHWVVEVAKNNPEKQFIIVGGTDRLQKNANNEVTKNVFYLGYVSDETVKALYTHCCAFLFPSICEGFGIPPMEALACGAKIIVSNVSCLPEIYKKAAYYIDPYKYDYDLDTVLEQSVEDSSSVLDCFSWEKTAKIIYDILVRENSCHAKN